MSTHIYKIYDSRHALKILSTLQKKKKPQNHFYLVKVNATEKASIAGT